MPLLEIRDLRKRFGAHEVLRGVTLEVEPLEGAARDYREMRKDKRD